MFGTEEDMEFFILQAIKEKSMATICNSKHAHAKKPRKQRNLFTNCSSCPWHPSAVTPANHNCKLYKILENTFLVWLTLLESQLLQSSLVLPPLKDQQFQPSHTVWPFLSWMAYCHCFIRNKVDDNPNNSFMCLHSFDATCSPRLDSLQTSTRC